MSDLELQTVKINIGSNMYSRFSDLPNTVPHVLSEFIDNALQSYYDNRDLLHNFEKDYKLQVKIDIKWNAKDRASEITVTDNAAGICSEKYTNAFMPARTPDNNTGLNEFGMGLKTAALWLGETWSVRTKAINESVERLLSFNLNNVTANDLEELPIEVTEKSNNEHYTIIKISDLTDNAPAKRSLDRIRQAIASIYRKSLRLNEIDIVVCGEKISFAEYPILIAPPAKNPTGSPVEWKKNVSFSYGKYKASGFIAILRDIDSTKNGFVLLRRGRVIVGAETDGRYFPKSISGSAGTFRYKRMFGEIELEGFNVSFNKNVIQDKENLDALMESLKDAVRTPEFDILSQADNYRLNENQKVVSKLVKRHDIEKKKNAAPITINTKTKEQEAQPKQLSFMPYVVSEQPQLPEVVLGETFDDYKIDGKRYKLKVEYVNTGDELFWNDVSHKDEGIIVCKINTEHNFFHHFGKPTEAVVAIIKTIAISKFVANTNGNDTTRELLQFFNVFIKQTKV